MQEKENSSLPKKIVETIKVVLPSPSTVVSVVTPSTSATPFTIL
jgi:hypothetical protein